MRHIQTLFLALIILLGGFWALAETWSFPITNVFELRGIAIQFSGVVAIGFMSITMMLTLRLPWLERWMSGLDKMYRLHKWLGISILVVAICHWLWAVAPKWASGLGWTVRSVRPPRVPITDPLQAFLVSLRHPAESIGEWAFYAAALLIVLALVRYFPYRLFYKTHRLLAVVYLAVAFHAVVLIKFSYWTSPLGLLMAILLTAGILSAVIVLLGLHGKARQVWGRISSLQAYPGVRTLEIVLDMSREWPGHKAGQFAFAMSDPSEGPHPYTIASDWNVDDGQICFLVKELGDHTRLLKSKLKPGQEVRVEGPYGGFTFDDGYKHQIWVAGGIGITPFLARMKHMALNIDKPDWPKGQIIDLFHTTSDVDEQAFLKLAADAKIANIRLHLMIDLRDGRLTGERLRAAIPDWRTSSLWFCGPEGFAADLTADLTAHGFPTGQNFHQEFFTLR
ncbi:Carnitine monooxygenase reductase subunit (plasmid) [Asticcacaulis sp. MM231]|uniref:ferredoxin reductase family protein n=1 Tax=Asticcacaulis sp. MM231 TaxID=3157666 RepID=UPI0032D56C9E